MCNSYILTSQKTQSVLVIKTNCTWSEKIVVYCGNTTEHSGTQRNTTEHNGTPWLNVKFCNDKAAVRTVTTVF